MRDTAPDGDQLGLDSATTYLCNNYAAPLHRDKDTTPGLCANYELQALQDQDEYAFIYADYGIYFACQPNSLWSVIVLDIPNHLLNNVIHRSFRGSTAHGTVLPSCLPLRAEDRTIAVGQPGGGDPGCPPPRISNGLHKTKTARNSEAAAKYQTVRNYQPHINSYYT